MAAHTEPPKGPFFSLDLSGTSGQQQTPHDLPDALEAPHLYAAISIKRILAYFIDVLLLAIIGAIIWGAVASFSLMTFGLAGAILWPLFPLIPIAYHVGLIVRPRGRTLGMSMMGIEVRTLDGNFPSLLHALVMVGLFYVTLLFPLLLLAPLFNRRRQTLHDIFSGTVVINRQYTA